jgi:hypothetical protein
VNEGEKVVKRILGARARLGKKKCKCVADVNKALRKKSSEELVTTIPMRSKLAPQVILMTEFVGEKAGSRSRNKTLIAASFCPFCGVEYPSDA